MANIHTALANVRDDDPEVKKALVGIRSALLPINDMIANGPNGRTVLYRDISRGLLVTYTIGGRRFAYALDYAKYLVALTRMDAAEGKVHQLAKPEHRAAHVPKNRRDKKAA